MRLPPSLLLLGLLAVSANHVLEHPRAGQTLALSEAVEFLEVGEPKAKRDHSSHVLVFANNFVGT